MAFLRSSFKAINCLLSIEQVQTTTIRSTSFFVQHTAEALWKGATSVSNAGRKRGRGKGSGRKVIKNLNKGQVIGKGKINMEWPGLTTNVFRGRELVTQQQLPEDPERTAKLIKLRNQMGVFRRMALSPMDRGWSGKKLPGRSIGPPDPIGEDSFEGFDTKVLEYKSVFNMSGNMGRKRQMSAFVVTGNGDGLAGFGLGKGIEGKAALKAAKNRAGQRLMYIERYNNHTVYHDFFSQFGQSKIFVKKMHEGYGLICHRAIKNICEIVGIKDLHAKLEGSHNLQHVVKAFFLGLLRQKRYDRIADETGYNIVEFKEENDNYPKVVASPSCPNNNTKQIPEFDEYIMEGKVVLKTKVYPPYYKCTQGWQTHLKKTTRYRNALQVRVQLAAQAYKEGKAFKQRPFDLPKSDD